MWEKRKCNPIKRKTMVCFVIFMTALASVTPALANYLGPNRTVTETSTICKINLYECQYVPTRDMYRYKVVDGWACADESKAWKVYPNQPDGRGCFDVTSGDTYWSKVDIVQEVTNTYPPATISSALQNCTSNNGWCTSVSQVALSGNEPITGYNIIAIEGSLNGQTFACSNASCSVPLFEGDNSLAYWALSSWGDSSTMGTLTAKVDSQLPDITSLWSGIAGSNGWYLGPVSFIGSASDVTSGLANFTCTLDGITLNSCTSITINDDGEHVLVLRATDNAGNVRNLIQNTSVDTQRPSLNAALSGSLGSNSWYTNAGLSVNAADAMPGSGLSALEYNLDNGTWAIFPSTGVLTLPDGKHTVNIRAVDTAGHTTSSSKSFWLDSTAPSIVLDPIARIGNNNWYTSNLNLTASANDNTSGIDSFEYLLDSDSWTAYTAPLIITDGSHNISFWAQDAAGLVTKVDRMYQVDTRAPQIGGNVSGITGTNGWYTSDVTLSASASDPAPGSGVEEFAYILNNDTTTPYTAPLILVDGQHTIQFNAQDHAGLAYSVTQSINVDTIHPSLAVSTTLPSWVKDSVEWTGTAGDNGSGLSTIEISIDNGQTWQAATGTISWSYDWNTQNNPDGTYSVHTRATDQAGLVTETILNVGLDNHPPKITVPASWLQWDTVTIDIWDNYSGLSETNIEIIDPGGHWSKRVLHLDPQEFPLNFKWDRRFGDGTIAPPGNYELKVIAIDGLGNVTQQSAFIKVLLDILPAGPTATPQIYSRTVPTSTPVYTAAPISSPTVTPTAVISVFGEIAPTPQPTQTPTSQLPPRATPTQMNVIDWLKTIFVSNANETEQTTEIQSTDDVQSASQSADSQSNVLWGATAAAMVGAVTAYAAEERRKQQEEKARQAALEAQQEQRHAKMQARQLEKMEAQRAQEQAWEEARWHELNADYQKHMVAKMEQDDAVKDAQWLASQLEIQKREDEKKKADELKAKQLEARKAAYYNAINQDDTNWWERTKSFISDKIIDPLNFHVYNPFIQPAIERTKQFVASEAAWLDDHINQPFIQPAIENSKQFLADEGKWLNQYVYEPYLQLPVTNTKKFLANEGTWLNENIYQAYIKPVVENNRQFLIDEGAWLNANIYQPYLQPTVNTVNEKIYQPYIQPALNHFNQYVYKPYFKPVVDDVSNWGEQAWSKYGEWVHSALDVAGFIPGLGEIADGINGLIYLTEGRYLEAGISALSMIPIVGDFGKAGKVTLSLAEEVVEDAATGVAQEVAEGLMEKAAKETLEQAGEGLLKETAKEVIEDEWVHATLEIIDAVPNIGPIPNAINSLIYLGQGRVLEASVSAISMIPIVGDLARIGINIGKNIFEKAAKQTTEELLVKAAKETAKEVTEKALKEISQELIEKTTHEVVEVATAKEVIPQLSQSVLEEAARELVDEVTTATVKEAIDAGVEKVSTETAQRVIQETVEGKVVKLPSDIADTLTPESANELAAKISENLGGKKVWISVEQSSIYISNPPEEGFILAERLRNADLTNKEEVRRTLREIAELTSRGSGNHVVLGPFGTNGDFIQKALDTNGIFWDVGDELWEAVQESGIDMFELNDQFLQLHVSRNIDRFDVIETNVSEVINNFENEPPSNWMKIRYTHKEILDLATMPNIPYQLVDNSWVRVDLTK